MTTIDILPFPAPDYDRVVTDYSRVERLALCDLFDELGPDQPTLCEGWDTFDLAVHLYVRESDPMAGPGIMISALADTTEKRMERAKAKLGFAGVVNKVRSGPPRASIYGLPLIGHQLNTTEYLVHHEDVRRAQPDWAPRQLPRPVQDELWTGAALFGRRAAGRRGLVLRRSDVAGVERRFGAGGRTVEGEPMELLLWLSGRRDVAQVTVS
jgi:uncharacterized protein (TIGR03085 family)